VERSFERPHPGRNLSGPQPLGGQGSCAHRTSSGGFLRWPRQVAGSRAIGQLCLEAGISLPGQKTRTGWNEDRVGCHERVHREKVQGGRAVDEHEVELILDRGERCGKVKLALAGIDKFDIGGHEVSIGRCQVNPIRLDVHQDSRSCALPAMTS